MRAISFLSHLDLSSTEIHILCISFERSRSTTLYMLMDTGPDGVLHLREVHSCFKSYFQKISSLNLQTMTVYHFYQHRKYSLLQLTVVSLKLSSQHFLFYLHKIIVGSQIYTCFDSIEIHLSLIQFVYKQWILTRQEINL